MIMITEDHSTSTKTTSSHHSAEEEYVEVGEPSMNKPDFDKYTLSKAVERVTTNYPQATMNLGWKGMSMMAFRSLGVIYGDIGTSPLYVISSIFAEDIKINEESVLGACSLIIWSLILVVTIKYIGLVMMMDNHGEGGIFALLSLIPTVNNRLKQLFIAITLIGSSLVIGDGVITPAISVLSAIEGIETQAAGLSKYVVWITSIIILFLFLIQKFGTSRIGGSFGPIMLVWFVTCAVYGVLEIVQKPVVLAAFSPSYGMKFLFSGQGGFAILGTVVLCVTGVEALYADLGHFGRMPIRISWMSCVFVSLILNYLGQGAHLLRHPEDVSVLFYKSVPEAMFWPELILATLATIIASQAMISGVFSLINQAVSFQCFPNVKIIHTSRHQLGQVYIPELNYIMMVLTIAIVFIFQKSTNLSAAYGVAVTGVMFLTSIMYVSVLILRDRAAWWKIALYVVVFFTIDISFFGTSLLKIPHGGWLPIVIGLVFATVMWVWKMGREETEAYAQSVALSYDDLKTMLQHYQVARVPTTGVYMTSRYDATPQSISVLLPRTRSLPSPCIFLTVKFVPVPYVSEADRVTLHFVPELEGVTHAIILYGFAEIPNLSQIVQTITSNNQLPGSYTHTDLTIPPVTYYVTRERIRKNKTRWVGRRLWVRLYDLLLSSTRNKADVFNIPPQEMVDIGFMVVL